MSQTEPGVASLLPAFPYPPLQKTQGRGTLQHWLRKTDQKLGPPANGTEVMFSVS
jgi:hypothetical protein